MTTLDDFALTATAHDAPPIASPPRAVAPLPPPTAKQTRPVQDPGLVQRIADTALDIAEREGYVTADEVRATMPNAPRSKAFGAAFSKLVNEGKLVPGEYKPSTTPSSHGRRIRVYHLRRIRACLGPEQPEVNA